MEEGIAGENIVDDIWDDDDDDDDEEDNDDADEKEEEEEKETAKNTQRPKPEKIIRKGRRGGKDKAGLMDTFLTFDLSQPQS